MQFCHYRKPANLSVDELRTLNGHSSSHEGTTVSPTTLLKDGNKIYINGGGGHSSGFNSGGDGSTTCSNGATPPPLGSSTPNIQSSAMNGGMTQNSTIATITNGNLESLNDSNILDEPELQTAPWFQAGMPRYHILMLTKSFIGAHRICLCFLNIQKHKKCFCSILGI